MFLKGRDDKYIETINPLIESGHMQASIDGIYKYPYQISLYCGITCMFACIFCGRSKGAHYKKSQKIYNIFKNVIDQDDGLDPYRINISGGEEPLTNPHINQICKDLFDGGYKSRMLTNFYMATPSWLSKNEWINSLDRIRVSLYGIEEEETIATTQHKKSWHYVKNNLVKYNRSSEKTKVHLNYIVLPKNYKKLDKLVDFVKDIGGVDHISLREDHSHNFIVDNRTELRERLEIFDEKMKMINVDVDYGYALHQVKNGQNVKLVRAELKHLTPTQSPQIKVSVDPNGDIFSYQDIFLNRPGAKRHSLGNVHNSSLEQELKKQKKIEPKESDLKFLDTFNQVIEIYKWNASHS